MSNPTVKVNGSEVLVKNHQYKSGTKGFLGRQKVVIGGKMYQANIDLYEIGSKGKNTKSPL